MEAHRVRFADEKELESAVDGQEQQENELRAEQVEVAGEGFDAEEDEDQREGVQQLARPDAERQRRVVEVEVQHHDEKDAQDMIEGLHAVSFLRALK